MLSIKVNNNVCSISGNVRTVILLREKLRVRHPNAFYLRTKGCMPPGWDGYMYYITEAGNFDTGLLPKVLAILKERKLDVEFEDNRDFKFQVKIPKFLQGGYEPRGYQMEAVTSVLENYVGPNKDFYFPQGILFAATNAGKTIIAATFHASVRSKQTKTVLLLNQSDLFVDACKDIPKMLGADEVGWIQGNNIKWANFMICMVPTLRSRLSTVMAKLASYNVCIFDECDTAAAKTNKTVLKAFFNAPIRVGMSGSVGKHKDPMKNWAIHRLFGDITYTIKNHELVDMGVSSKVEINLFPGNERPGYSGDYAKEYLKCIIKNKARNTLIIDRLTEHIKKRRLPILIITPRHKHLKILYNRISELYGDVYTIKMVHHKTPNRKKIQLQFANGEIDILIGSYILKRGKNFPLMRALINAGSGDSSSNALQILGRAMRKHESKDLTVMDDFWDLGEYLRKHSLHRYLTYKGENLPLNILFNKKLLRYKKL